MEKIVRASVTEQIFETLRDKILSGDWKAGDKIPSENELSELLGVSRMSLKMAIQKLNVLGLTETKVGEGTFVREFSMKSYFEELLKTNLIPQDYMQLNDFRIYIESSCIQLSLEQTDNEPYLKNLESIFGEMKDYLEKENFTAFHDAHFRFHMCICNMTHNQLFILVYKAVSDVLFEVYKANTQKMWKLSGKYENTIAHHQKILDGLKEGNLQKCMEAQQELRKNVKLFYL